MTKASNLEGLTIAEIKNQYPNGAYKSSMLKKDIITAALKSIPEEKKSTSKSQNTEPPYRKG